MLCLRPSVLETAAKLLPGIPIYTLNRQHLAVGSAWEELKPLETSLFLLGLGEFLTFAKVPPDLIKGRFLTFTPEHHWRAIKIL